MRKTKDIEKRYEKLRDKVAQNVSDLQLASKHTELMIENMKSYFQSLSAAERILQKVEDETGRSLEDMYRGAGGGRDRGSASLQAYLP